mmetsp:Transcript_2171/g.4480  ORF Transcript_2171/g.4480 Transcript_2171/m.4480 type:complete len:92 (+) Transcript_2171:1654-1929(+)
MVKSRHSASLHNESCVFLFVCFPLDYGSVHCLEIALSANEGHAKYNEEAVHPAPAFCYEQRYRCMVLSSFMLLGRIYFKNNCLFTSVCVRV